MEILEILNKENVTKEELKTFRTRNAVRGVIFDKDNNIALLQSITHGYFGLPGGKVEDGETNEQGILRESLEETGCTVEIITLLGQTLEYRKQHGVINCSVGYAVRVIGEKGLPTFIGDENELEKNSIVVWVTIEVAIKLLFSSINTKDNLYHRYCLERDLVFLEKARN